MPTCWNCLVGATHECEGTTKSDVKLPPHLSSDRDIHIIISVLSGDQKAREYYDETLKPVLDKHGIKAVVHVTKSAQSISDLCRGSFSLSASKGVKQTILLLSGDGGVVDIVNTFSSLLMRDTYDSRVGSVFVKPVVVLFPLGTANACAWSAGVATDPLKSMLEGKPKALPSFEAKFSPGSKIVTDEGRGREEVPLNYDGDAAVIYGAVVASWGLHASLVAMSDTTEYRKHGLERFKMAAQRLLEDEHVYKAIVKIRKKEGDQWQALTYPNSTAGSEGATEHAYILCSLVSNLEERFMISPASQPLDGKLRLVAIRPDGPPEIMRLLGLAYQQGKHVQEESVIYEEVESVRIDFQEDHELWRQVCIDGKIVAMPEGGWFEVRILPGMGMDGRRVIEVVC